MITVSTVNENKKQIYCKLTLVVTTSDFTENFQVKENKTKMRNIYLHFFIWFFRGLRLGFKFGLGCNLGIVVK